jgi:hypothetical protein
MSRLGPAFDAFALIVLPVLAFIGAVTFARLVQLSLEDMAYARRIGRLRDFYVTVAPRARAVCTHRPWRRRRGIHGRWRARPTGW